MRYGGGGGGGGGGARCRADADSDRGGEEAKGGSEELLALFLQPLLSSPILFSPLLACACVWMMYDISSSFFFLSFSCVLSTVLKVGARWAWMLAVLIDYRRKP